jgi:poly(3-hydroxybutyrate) depolymerase
VILAVLALAAAQAPAAAPGEVAVVRGGITPRIVCASDPRYSYALYLPKDYAPGRPWPLLYIFDPRGRGAFAAELFADAAAAHGFVIASSNDTRSDDPTAPNAAAVTAVWVDTHRRIEIDPKRVYAAGFSGTARLAARLGLTTRGAVGGAIAAGGVLVYLGASMKPGPFGLWGARG